MIPLSGKTAIAGIGQTSFTKEAGCSTLKLALEAIMNALEDAGLHASAVDGLVTFSMDHNPQTEIARNLGLGRVRFLSQTPFGGGGACGVVQHAALAIDAGIADTVVCYRALDARSGQRYGRGGGAQKEAAGHASTEEVGWGWYVPHGLMTAAGWVAMAARRYMHEYGATSEDFGRIAVIDRANAATNPNAWFYGRPITIDDHQASRMIVDPLRLLDCCQESDGAVAFVVTSTERARDLRHTPAVIRAAAQGMGPDQEVMTSYYRDRITDLPEMGVVSEQLWQQAGIARDDIDALILYDHFTPYVLIQLEELGFCGRGEAKDLVASGALELDGRWPLNPHGGLIGEAYIHGLNGITEAVRQLRGEAVNQIHDAETVLVTGGTGVPTSGLILGR